MKIRAYTSDGNGRNSCTWACDSGYEPTGSDCSRICAVGKYRRHNYCLSCRNKPSNSYYTSNGAIRSNCSWSCNSGYTESGSSCTRVTCGVGQYLSGSSCRSCTNKPSNSTYTSTGNTCSWSCNSGYRKSSNNRRCTFIHIYTLGVCGEFIATCQSGDVINVRSGNGDNMVYWNCLGNNSGSIARCSMSREGTGTWRTRSAPSCSTSCGQLSTRKYGSVYCSGGSCNPSTKPSRPSRDCSATIPCGGGPGSGCFIARTKVKTPQGLRNIEDIKPGEKIITSGGVEKVMKKYEINFKGKLYAFNGSDNYFVTETHPFMTLEGWKSFDPEGSRKESPGIKVSQLKTGDTLLRKDGSQEKLESFDWKYRETKVYNFGVNGTNDFYANGYWVHNVDLTPLLFQSVEAYKPPTDGRREHYNYYDRR